MFGGLPTPTETEAPDHHHHHHHHHLSGSGGPPPLMANGSPVGVDQDGGQQYEDHKEDDSCGGHQTHLTTSQSAHITLR